MFACLRAPPSAAWCPPRCSTARYEKKVDLVVVSAARASHSDKRAKRVTRKYAGRPIPLPDGRRSYNRSDKANTLHFERHELRERLAPHPTPTCKRGFCFAGTQDHTRTLGSTEQLCTVLQSRNARLGRPAQPQAKQPSDQVTKPTTAVTLNVHTAARACSRLCISAREDVSAPARQPEHRKPSPATPRDISWDLAYREVDTHPIGLVNGGGGAGGGAGTVRKIRRSMPHSGAKKPGIWNVGMRRCSPQAAGRGIAGALRLDRSGGGGRWPVVVIRNSADASRPARCSCTVV